MSPSLALVAAAYGPNDIRQTVIVDSKIYQSIMQCNSL
jgi:hypothetical protein